MTVWDSLPLPLETQFDLGDLEGESFLRPPVIAPPQLDELPPQRVTLPSPIRTDPPHAAVIPTQLASVKILGSRVHMISLESTLELIGRWLEEPQRSCRHVVANGFHGLWEAHKDPQLRELLKTADVWLPDGIAPVWVARLRGFRHARRVTGPELMTHLLERGRATGMRSFLYGDTPATLELLRKRINERYPGNQIVGSLAPPFRELARHEDEQIVRRINAARPDLLWVALGAPKQDRWIAEHRHDLDVKVAVGVGAAFRFLSGQTKRAPKWIGDLGFEWAYRLLQEPRRCWRRCFVQGPRFLAHVALEMSGFRSYD